MMKMPSDYISKSALLKQLESDDSLKHARKLIHLYVEEFPTADVEPVVHCGECRFRICNKKCELDEQPLRDWDDDDFCSQGERKDGTE
jgi:hypothetical protein